MDGQSIRPALLSKVRSKYGRRDYKRFDNIASTHMRAGRGSIGKVEIDCRFMFTQSHWGVIGESKNPGGIIYLDLDFSQPADCKLESATITVTLTEDDGEEARIQHRSACPVKFTDHYGPKCVRGPESLVQTRKIQNRTPEVQLFGYGAGGLGIDKEKVVQTSGRWDFSGYISSTKESIWYNCLRWELKENSLEWQPTHNNLFHTAFALEHNATRFSDTCQKDWEQDTNEIKSKSGGRGVWLGVTAILLHWLGKVGVLLSRLASIVVAVPSTPKLETRKVKKRNKNKLKMAGFDGASESSRTKTSATRSSYPVRGRLRGRRGYLNVDVAKRKRQKWEDIESNSSNS
jgi:hypothetical protein